MSENSSSRHVEAVIVENENTDKIFRFQSAPPHNTHNNPYTHTRVYGFGQGGFRVLLLIFALLMFLFVGVVFLFFRIGRGSLFRARPNFLRKPFFKIWKWS